jgi:predicted phosphoribosyltransferase
MQKFLNRLEAGEMLAEKLTFLKDSPCIVMAIPRGGVPVGFAISRKLKCPLGLVWVKKIGHPLNPELAIGAVSPDDYCIEYKSAASESYIQSEIIHIRTRFNEMKKKLNDDSEKLDLINKTIILVDDGIATGHTMEVAVKLLRNKSPAQIIVATPVAPVDIKNKLNRLADDIITVYEPKGFTGIGFYYENFTQLEDEEVKEYLTKQSIA